jgi:membrane-bound metal-dependent hydrolase YbcI (DUF457 family)
LPDWISHIVTGHITSRAGGGRFFYGALLLGSVLPDIISYLPWKGMLLIVGKTTLLREALYCAIPLHSMPASITAALMVSFFFREELRGKVLASLTAGLVLHILMDLSQYQYDGGYLLLAPFSYDNYQIGLFWNDRWPFWIAALVPAGVLVELLYRRSRRSSQPPPSSSQTCSVSDIGI